MDESINNNKLTKFTKLFPLYAGLSGDLLFWVAIDTLFLTVVKNFNAAQIVSLTSISLITCIILQIPILKIIERIGNTTSVRCGSFLLLFSSILLTFGKNYIIIVVGKIFYEIAYTFQNMANVVLKNNLELQNRNDDYIKIKTEANTVYAMVTMIISFIASIMFNINNYLPMLCCILFCLICFILSFKIKDYSKYNKIKKENSRKKVNIKYSKLIIILMISYAMFYPLVNSSQSNGKLFIQQELMKNFNVEVTALIIGAILSISRIVRLLSNMVFNKIHKKYKDKIGVILPIFLTISVLLMILGSFINISLILKFSLMTLGYIIILFVRDPFKVYMQDVALNNTNKEYQQNIITTLDLARKIGRAILSLSFTLILINNPIISVMTILLVLAIIEIFVSIKLYKLILISKKIEDL